MRSVEVDHLLAELKGEHAPATAKVIEDSRLVVLLGETNEREPYTAEEAKLILSSPGTVARFFEAMDYPDEVGIELHDIQVEADVLKELETFAESVDEL